MNDEKVITPFEIGVLAALTVIGKAIAMNPHLDMDSLKKDAEAVMSAMPDHPKWKGGEKRVHQAPIECLLAGTEKVQR
ncbi:hypothetical protein [Pseudomonas viridiflava]|uniref:hypothetical protein n=1 Tax=Pseudomonas viridiflava TaxID=33069 RepID=UPI000F02D60D|nr:hypothetical protein [Pseudomonas viridiflava]